MRLRLCAASRVKASLLPSRSNSAPQSISSWMARRPLFDQRVNGRAVAQAVAGEQRVLLVQFHLVVVAQRDRDATLRVFGRGFAEAVLGDDQDRARFGEFDCRAQPRHSGSYYKKIRIHGKVRIAGCTNGQFRSILLRCYWTLFGVEMRTRSALFWLPIRRLPRREPRKERAR